MSHLIWLRSWDASSPKSSPFIVTLIFLALRPVGLFYHLGNLLILLYCFQMCFCVNSFLLRGINYGCVSLKFFCHLHLFSLIICNHWFPLFIPFFFQTLHLLCPCIHHFYDYFLFPFFWTLLQEFLYLSLHIFFKILFQTSHTLFNFIDFL